MRGYNWPTTCHESAQGLLPATGGGFGVAAIMIGKRVPSMRGAANTTAYIFADMCNGVAGSTSGQRARKDSSIALAVRISAITKPSLN